MPLAKSAVPILDVLNAAEKDLTAEEVFERIGRYYRAPRDLAQANRDLNVLVYKGCAVRTSEGRWRITEYGRRLRKTHTALGAIKVRAKSGDYARIR